MRILQIFPYYLLSLPFKQRLCMLILCWLPTLLLLIPHHGPFDILLVLIVILATLLFKYRGGLIMVVLATIQTSIYNTMRMGSHWSYGLCLSFATGVFVLLAETWVIGYQRNALEDEKVIHQQASQAYEQQRQLNLIKDHFLLNVSHELRTPLTEVRGYLELLQEYRERLDEQTQTTFISNAVRGCEELQLLIGNMLDAVKVDIEAGEEVQREDLNVAELVQEVINSFSPQNIEQYTLHLGISPALTVWSDPQHTRQIMRNLLSNAFKYSLPHTSVFIDASFVATSDPSGMSQLLISITDQGSGIAPSDIPLLFNRFVRLKRDLSGPIRGSGLGLYICKQLVEGLGGKIWVESSGIAGEGSRFSFTLPTHSPLSGPELASYLIGHSTVI